MVLVLRKSMGFGWKGRTGQTDFALPQVTLSTVVVVLIGDELFETLDVAVDV